MYQVDFLKQNINAPIIKGIGGSILLTYAN